MSPISRSLPLENIKEGTPAARETKYKTLEKNAAKFFTQVSHRERHRGQPLGQHSFYVTQRLETN